MGTMQETSVPLVVEGVTKMEMELFRANSIEPATPVRILPPPDVCGVDVTVNIDLDRSVQSNHPEPLDDLGTATDVEGSQD
jgi:hypothetical protein